MRLRVDHREHPSIIRPTQARSARSARITNHPSLVPLPPAARHTPMGFGEDYTIPWDFSSFFFLFSPEGNPQRDLISHASIQTFEGLSQLLASLIVLSIMPH